MVQTFSALSDILKSEKVSGCFVDTSVLFSATYPLDQFNEECESIFENLAAHDVPIFTNVNVRAEFLENHRRVLIGEALIDFLNEAEGEL
jgi:predicted nucleic acid-binding protein